MPLAPSIGWVEASQGQQKAHNSSLVDTDVLQSKQYNRRFSPAIFPKQLPNSPAFPGFPEKWSPRAGDQRNYHKTIVSAPSAIIVRRHHAITLARFFGRSGGGLCRLARARNASATRCECDWIIPFQPGVSITSVAWLHTHTRDTPLSTHPASTITRLTRQVKVTGPYSTKESVGGVLISLSRPWARRWINHLSLWRMASVMADLRLPSQPQGIAAPDRYQIILLGVRGTCVWTTCPKLLPDSGTAESRTGDLLCRKPSP